ncbi:MAG: hypothetical protein RML56_13950 [Burkholderiales bacterium]|nr:hypothetical protein [Burkholderiales bacterium]
MLARSALALGLVLLAPAAAAQDCAPIPGLPRLLAQWHTNLEKWRGRAFLLTPGARLETDCGERVRVLMQWKQAIELWRRASGLDEPALSVVADCRRTMELLARWRYAIELWYGGPLVPAPDVSTCLRA